MAKRMSITINEDIKNSRVTFIIEHDSTSSFSRSIRPKFNAEYKAWVVRTGHYSVTPTVESEFAAEYTKDTADLPLRERRCISVFHVSI